ncbi:MAG: TauD/TfdA family dioxygenase [Pseudomonadota bacterium]
MTGFVGAEITGLYLKTEISPDTAKALRDALGKHLLLVLRDQHLDLPDQKRLTQVFGAPMRLPYVAPIPDDPEVIAVLKTERETNTGVFGGEWHSDFSFLTSPPAGSILTAVEIPPFGGDTMWSAQTAVFESLSKDLRSFVESRRAVHVGKPYGAKHAPSADTRANVSIQMTRGDPEADRETLHPAVITDPRTGRRALYLNPIYVTRFEDMTEEESTPYLDALYKHAVRPDFSCRLKWRSGDVAIWDNRMTLHYATNDYDGFRRLLYRTTFAGSPPA